MTVIHELARQHARAGGSSEVIVNAGTRHDYDSATCVEVQTTGRTLRRPAALVDAVTGRLGRIRPLGAATYRGLVEAVPAGHAGPVFAHNAVGAVPALGRRCKTAQLYLYAHNQLFRSYGNRELKSVLRSASAVVCVSEFLADRVRERLPGETRVHAVLNGVDTERFRPVAVERRERDDPVVLFLGRVIPDKGAHLLLQAALRLAPGRRFRVWVVGRPGFAPNAPLSDYERSLRRLAAPLGERAQFRGFADRSGVLEVYQVASIACVPSDWDDPCPLTTGEAMACGLPTVVARRGGIPEVGAAAVQYFDPRRSDELAEVLAALLDSPQERHRWGQMARARAEELSWKHQYERLLAVLQA